MWDKSSAERILLVEWRRKAAGMSSISMPQPLSVTRIKEMPPSRISTVMEVAPASMAFSRSSFTMEAGRSITSPAAILSIVTWSKTCILLILPPVFQFILKLVQRVQGVNGREMADVQIFDLLQYIVVPDRVEEGHLGHIHLVVLLRLFLCLSAA